MRTRLRYPATWLAAALLCAALLASSAVPAYAVTNTAIRAKQHQADAAVKKQQDLGDELEARGEELVEIESKVAATRRARSDSPLFRRANTP